MYICLLIWLAMNHFFRYGSREHFFFCFLNGLAKCLNKMVIYIYLFDKMMMMMMMKRGRARILPVKIQSHKQLVSVRVLRKRFSMVKTKRRRNRYQNI